MRFRSISYSLILFFISASSFASLKVMTRNLYIGTDTAPIISEKDPKAIPGKVETAFRLLRQMDFPARAKLLAKEIVREKPELIGLQEVSQVFVQTPGDSVVGGNKKATNLYMDYLDILLTEVKKQGLLYKVAASVTNTDVEFPRSNAPSFDDVRVVDRDVILVLEGVTVSNLNGLNFQTDIQLGPNSVLKRGYVSVQVEHDNEKFLFVNTHLETESTPHVSEAQASELVDYIDQVGLPTIAVGDFNSQIGAASVGAYDVMTTNGFSDAAVSKGQTVAGTQQNTCCHKSDLSNIDSHFIKRIDYIFHRGFSGGAEAKTYVIGNDQRNKSISGHWPSDHGGVVGIFDF